MITQEKYKLQKLSHWLSTELFAYCYIYVSHPGNLTFNNPFSVFICRKARNILPIIQGGHLTWFFFMLFEDFVYFYIFACFSLESSCFCHNKAHSEFLLLCKLILDMLCIIFGIRDVLETRFKNLVFKTGNEQ